MEFPDIMDPDIRFVSAQIANLIMAVSIAVVLWIMGAPAWGIVGFLSVAIMVGRAHVAAMAAFEVSYTILFTPVHTVVFNREEQQDEQEPEGQDTTSE